MRGFLRFIAASLVVLVLVAIAGAGVGLAGLWFFGRGLPDYSQLAHYEPPVTTRVYAGDGRLMTEFAREKRVFVPIENLPKKLIEAFLSAEDKNFYEHQGIDPLGILRAIYVNLNNLGSGRRLVGASTITQQVAKNFLLGSEVSYKRKVREAILAFRIERALAKERILELYLNEIYLGFQAYGVAAAALYYFDKSLDELTIGEMAFLAALPKAPNNYHPVRRPEAAKARRDYVLDRMLEDGYINLTEAAWFKQGPVTARQRKEVEYVPAEYFTEEVRRELAAAYGERALYEGGLQVRTSLDSHMQAIATDALRRGLIDYDRRHGYRGPLVAAKRGVAPRDMLGQAETPPGIAPWQMAVVMASDHAGHAEIALANNRRGLIPMDELSWARTPGSNQTVGPAPRRPADVLRPGDVILVEPIADKKDVYGLRQVPEVGGAAVVMDPHTGRVLAIVGGYSYDISQFNRAIQAFRQPGSASKPMIYLAALEAGLTPASRILDAPVAYPQGPGLPLWEPKNYDRKFAGPISIRRALEQSRNVPTVRIAAHVGMDKVIDVFKRLNVVDEMRPMLSMSLGAGETTLLRLTAAYATLVNGGKHVEPTLIDRVQDRYGKTVFRHDGRLCPFCGLREWPGGDDPDLPDQRLQVVSAQHAYQMVNLLTGVVERGTGTRVKAVGKPLAGKTGTTNSAYDAWFVGFAPDLAVGVFVGFDQQKTLGPRETGGVVAAPIFRDIVAKALEGQPAQPFRTPPGVRLVRVDPETSLPAAGPRAILEAFLPGSEPDGPQPILGRDDLNNLSVTGGLEAPGLGDDGEADPSPGGLY
ncbi:MAG: penicillin-binding protein 1A [Alphaproteobacteria bacterium]|nr:penicillin-binding protein 1A [Alphaproteobacteria bacterium]